MMAANSMTRDAYRLVLRLSGRLELLLFEEAARIAEGRDAELIDIEHVNVAMRALADEDSGLKRLLSGSEGVPHDERRAG